MNAALARAAAGADGSRPARTASNVPWRQRSRIRRRRRLHCGERLEPDVEWTAGITSQRQQQFLERTTRRARNGRRSNRRQRLLASPRHLVPRESGWSAATHGAGSCFVVVAAIVRKRNRPRPGHRSRCRRRQSGRRRRRAPRTSSAGRAGAPARDRRPSAAVSAFFKGATTADPHCGCRAAIHHAVSDRSGSGDSSRGAMVAGCKSAVAHLIERDQRRPPRRRRRQR